MTAVRERIAPFKQIKQLVRDNGLPPSPKIAGQVLGALRARSPDARLLGELIASDAALASAVIGAANLGMSARATPVASVRAAFDAVGFNTCALLIGELLATGAFPYTDHPRVVKQWHQSAAIAQCAGELARKLGGAEEQTARTYALFRDCGTLALLPCFSDYELVLENFARSSGPALITREEARFAINHARAGALLVTGLKLPAAIIQAIRDHHDFDRTAVRVQTSSEDARALIAIGLLAEEIDSRARHDRSCPDWIAGAPFVRAEFALDPAGLDLVIAEVLNTMPWSILHQLAPAPRR